MLASMDDGTAENPENIDTTWRMPPGVGGNLSCSPLAQRKLPFTCRDQAYKCVANSLCVENSTTCVTSRMTADGNYSREPNNTTELVCTKGSPEAYSGPWFFGMFGSHIYSDECANSNGESCPTFLDNGNYRKAWVSAT